MISTPKNLQDITLVRDLMTVGVPTCSPDTLIIELARVMVENDWEAVVVIDEGHAVGLVDRTALIRIYGHNRISELVAEEVMHPGVPTIPPDIPLTAAAQLMIDRGVRAMYLMHHAGGIEYPAAQLTFRHLLRHLTARDLSELKDLGIKADRQLPLDAFVKRRNEARQYIKGSHSSDFE